MEEDKLEGAAVDSLNDELGLLEVTICGNLDVLNFRHLVVVLFCVLVTLNLN